MLFKCTVSPPNVWHWSRSWSLLSQDIRVLPCFDSMNCHPSKLPLPQAIKPHTLKSYPFNFHMPRWVTLPDFSFLLGDTVGMAFKTNQPNSSMCKTPKYQNIIFLDDKNKVTFNMPWHHVQRRQSCRYSWRLRWCRSPRPLSRGERGERSWFGGHLNPRAAINWHQVEKSWKLMTNWWRWLPLVS